MDSKGNELILIGEGDIVGEIEVLDENARHRQYFAATKTDALLFICKSNQFL